MWYKIINMTRAFKSEKATLKLTEWSQSNQVFVEGTKQTHEQNDIELSRVDLDKLTLLQLCFCECHAMGDSPSLNMYPAVNLLVSILPATSASL